MTTGVIVSGVGEQLVAGWCRTSIVSALFTSRLPDRR
jgi:hypothetical protein